VTGVTALPAYRLPLKGLQAEAATSEKANCDHLANFAGFQEGNEAWFYSPTHTRGKSLKLQSSWEGLYKVIAWISDMVC
jgi:hypothetical protein